MKIITKKLAIIAGSSILLIGALAAIYHHTHNTLHFNFNGPTPIKIGYAKEITIPNAYTTTGNIIALQTADISPKVSGYVTKILYHEGQQVKPGQTLVQLDNKNEQEALQADRIKAELSKTQNERDSKLLKRGLILQDTQYNQNVVNEENIAKINQDLTNLDNKTIRAPFAGIIGSKTISIGDYIQAGKNILTLTNLNSLIAKYYLPSSLLNQIKLGQQIRLHSDINPELNGAGYVTYIAPTIDTDSQSIEVHAKIDNRNQQFKPGEYIKVTQTIGNVESALVVPTTSIVVSLSGSYVYQVKDNKAVKVPVITGRHINGYTVITKGLTNHAPIVIIGQSELHAGKTVKIINSPSKTS